MQAAAMKLPRVELQHRHLLVAYRVLARPGWPESLDDALADSSIRPLVEGLARNRARAELLHSPEPARRPQSAAKPRRHTSARTFDARRAAANDRDE